MKVYILDADPDEFRGIYYAKKRGGVEFTKLFDGTPMKRFSERGAEFRFAPSRLPKGDTPSFTSNIPVFNRNAVNALYDMLEPNGELLPIT